MLSRWARSTFHSLTYSNYRTLWLGSTLAFLAFMMSSVVQSLVAFDLTGENGAVGAVLLGMGVSTIIVSPFGGVIADRVSKRKLLLFGQTVIGINFLFVGVLIVTGQITILWLMASTFVLGTMFSFIGPARQAWIGELLPGEALANGIAMQQMAMTATRIFGPFLAGGLVALAFVGSGGTYFFMGGLFAVVVATLAQLPATQGRERHTGPSVIGDMKLGWRHLSERPRVALLAVSFLGFVIAGYSYQVVLPGYLEHGLGRSPKEIGWFFGVGAVAGLVVTVLLAGIAGSKHSWNLMLGGGLVLGIGLALAAVAPGYGQALATMLLVGAGTSAFQMLNNSLIMQETDPAFYGRVMSITMLAWGFNGLAGFPFGLLADAIGERETLMVMAVLVVGVTAATATGHLLLSRRPTTQEAAAVSSATL
jgi:MFS family permease